MMVANQKYFDPPEKAQTFLRARGFAADGKKSGGIKGVAEVVLPKNTLLFRLYHDPSRRNGEWWSTPHEMSQVVHHFARDGAAFAEGRIGGKGVLHATLAVRHDWAGNTPDHLSRFWVARTLEPLRALVGEGDDAPDSSQKQNQKAVDIIDTRGRNRGVRQVFLPKPWEYGHVFHKFYDGPTDKDLLPTVKNYERQYLPGIDF